MGTQAEQSRTSAQASTTVSTKQATVSPRRQFLDALTREHATTMKVVRAFPADKADFKPHERSNSARQLVWTFVIEQGLMLGAITDTLKVGKFPPAPENYDAIVQQYQDDFNRLRATLETLPDEKLSGTVKFFTGPGQMGDVPKMEVLWFALMDQVHHRGQLSVYVRMAGGKVPSIYGPSADEPWS
jgi:uncharacterized damage-inducible protein DinB